jgi:DNA-binding response OmpR family regulator
VAAAKVLVVDDEPDIRELCRVNLEFSGFDVLEAGDGVEALEVCRREKPDLVFLDLMMPRLDGWGVLEALTADEETADIPVILLTARGADEDQIRGWMGGIVEFVGKPFNPMVLLDVARNALELRDPAERAARRERMIEQLQVLRRMR